MFGHQDAALEGFDLKPAPAFSGEFAFDVQLLFVVSADEFVDVYVPSAHGNLQECRHERRVN